MPWARQPPTVWPVDDAARPSEADDDALRQLPLAHAVALRLRAAGADEALIATALGVDVAAIEPILAVAEEKLRAVLEPTEQAREGPTG